jgi:hypothetical protein
MLQALSPRRAFAAIPLTAGEHAAALAFVLFITGMTSAFAHLVTLMQSPAGPRKR